MWRLTGIEPLKTPQGALLGKGSGPDGWELGGHGQGRWSTKDRTALWAATHGAGAQTLRPRNPRGRRFLLFLNAAAPEIIL